MQFLQVAGAVTVMAPVPAPDGLSRSPKLPAAKTGRKSCKVSEVKYCDNRSSHYRSSHYRDSHYRNSHSTLLFQAKRSTSAAEESYASVLAPQLLLCTLAPWTAP